MRERPRKIAIACLPIVYAAAAAAIAVSVFLLIFIAITEKRPLYVTTGSRTEVFADCDYTCHTYTVTGLKQGHRAEVTFLEQRRYVGVTRNTVSVTVFDSRGEDITYKYWPIYYPGALEVLPAEYTVTTGSAAEYYSGRGISSEECSISGLLPGHRADVLPCSRTDAGSAPNIPAVTIFDREGKDVTDQYVCSGDYGTLRVLPRKLAVSSSDVTLAYSGEPFIPSAWTLDSGTLAEGERLEVQFSSKYTQRGEYVNYFTVYIYREENGTPVDVTDNYILEEQYGTVRIE